MTEPNSRRLQIIKEWEWTWVLPFNLWVAKFIISFSTRRIPTQFLWGNWVMCSSETLVQLTVAGSFNSCLTASEPYAFLSLPSWHFMNKNWLCLICLWVNVICKRPYLSCQVKVLRKWGRCKQRKEHSCHIQRCSVSALSTSEGPKIRVWCFLYDVWCVLTIGPAYMHQIYCATMDALNRLYAMSDMCGAHPDWGVS